MRLESFKKLQIKYASNDTKEAKNNLISNFRRVLNIVFFWVFPQHQIVICRRFGTLCQFHLQRLGVEYWVGGEERVNLYSCRD
jgi:hypothetical protein